jgi:hypothetical protein
LCATSSNFLSLAIYSHVTSHAATIQLQAPSVSNKCCHDYLHLGALRWSRQRVTARLHFTKELVQGSWTYEGRNPQLQSSKWY